MSDKEVYERLARIEQQVGDHVALDDQRAEKLEEISDKLDAIQNELSRYRGTIGGILLVFTAVVTVIKMFGESFKNFLFSQ